MGSASRTLKGNVRTYSVFRNFLVNSDNFLLNVSLSEKKKELCNDQYPLSSSSDNSQYEMRRQMHLALAFLLLYSTVDPIRSDPAFAQLQH